MPLPDTTEMQEFTFPDEEKQEKVKNEDDFEIELEDDTPPADRGREPLPKTVVEEIEQDDLEDYSDKVKTRLKQMKKVWHDERREKEAATREREEAIMAATRLLEENRALKSRVNNGEQTIIDTYKESAERELEAAKREYRDAYDAGDSEKLADAQEQIMSAKIKLDKAINASRVKKEQNTLQSKETAVQIPQGQQQTPVRDPKAVAWQDRNEWFGQDDEMTSLALGLHEKLVKENGLAYATTDEYYKRIDQTMRKRFPEQFEEDERNVEVERPQRTKPSTVVAPATRSTASRKIKLTTSQLQIAKKFGLTPEQYAREILKMEAQ